MTHPTQCGGPGICLECVREENERSEVRAIYTPRTRIDIASKLLAAILGRNGPMQLNDLMDVQVDTAIKYTDLLLKRLAR